MVNRMPQPALMPGVTHHTPPLIHLSLVDWLDDEAHIVWRAGPYD
jgi:hypothetical protein